MGWQRGYKCMQCLMVGSFRVFLFCFSVSFGAGVGEKNERDKGVRESGRGGGLPRKRKKTGPEKTRQNFEKETGSTLEIHQTLISAANKEGSMTYFEAKHAKVCKLWVKNIVICSKLLLHRMLLQPRSASFCLFVRYHLCGVFACGSVFR